MKKFLQITGLLILGLMIAFFLGPSPQRPTLKAELPQVPDELIPLEQSITARERSIPNIKPDNQSRIIWYDSIPRKTEYCVVYLHGFNASWVEGEPIHREFSRRYGCNLYLPRLQAQGLDGKDAMLDFNTDSLLASAVQALAVGQKLGEKVILMSTSTGGTLSIWLAAKYPGIAGLIAYSPNVAIANPSAFLLNGPWGLQIAQKVYDSKYRSYDAPAEVLKYWNTTYRLEALVELENLLEYSMTSEIFSQVRQPFFMGYYFKNEEEQDKIVSVPAMLEMYGQIATPEPMKREVAFPNAGDHVVSSYLKSKDLPAVREATFAFAEEILHLRPVQ